MTIILLALELCGIEHISSTASGYPLPLSCCSYTSRGQRTTTRGLDPQRQGLTPQVFAYILYVNELCNT